MRDVPKKDQKVRFAIRIGNFEDNIYRDAENALKCFKLLFLAFARFDNEIIVTKRKKYERLYSITQEASRE